MDPYARNTFVTSDIEIDSPFSSPSCMTVNPMDVYPYDNFGFYMAEDTIHPDAGSESGESTETNVEAERHLFELQEANQVGLFQIDCPLILTALAEHRAITGRSS